ncbi:MAG TPA: exodeoxyribonuclease VII small subunit [Clostridiales bacterium]|nr:exodeoxyribonuclease VII small subunit [Clostridiales bacterium]
MAKEKDVEAYMQEMKEISEKLADEDIKLGEAVGLYKKGAETARKIEKMLEQYEEEIEIIGKDSEEV